MTRRDKQSNPHYMTSVRGKDIDFSPESIRVILQLPDIDDNEQSYEARRKADNKGNTEKSEEGIKRLAEEETEKNRAHLENMTIMEAPSHVWVLIMSRLGLAKPSPKRDPY
ncbi:hypothetical protein PIB30_100636 [Stylosanthes scabra]|uniref:Uncharacterized protein n=1 Tax=Stylosanthes scabra TaxID=79078 RepID=A0ABU6QYG9_9FABA|nr:hypothetical protein [Stylosanthes scabra]